MRIPMVILALAYFLLAFYGGAVGRFADGGELWERAILMGLHPLAAIGLLILVVVPRLKPFGLKIVRFLLILNIAADTTLAALILAGVSNGSWWLPLLFAAIPALGLIYSFTHPPGADSRIES